MLKDYYSLTKSGLIYGNLITVIGGFALGAAAMQNGMAGEGINFFLLLATIVGISLVMASGCVFNNYIDRDIDRRMDRTKDRALVTGKVSGRAAIIFAVVLGALGFAVLALFTNALTVAVAGVGFFAYIVLYSLWAKRRTPHGALVGAISGATPPVVGYCAASGRLDAGAWILFAILLLWQMPHFYAIAIRRADDYAKAGIPVTPVAYGLRPTKIAMAVYIILFTGAASLLAVFGYKGTAYLAVVIILGIVWLALCIKGFFIKDSGDTNSAYDADSVTKIANNLWARNMFFLSLVILVVLFVMIAL